MKILEMDFFREYIEMADYGDRMGWHERNGGNLSYRLTEEEVSQIAGHVTKDGAFCPIGTTVKELGGEYFLVSGTGKYFHNMKKEPYNCTGIIRLNEEGDQYQIVWGFNDGGRPTSELPTHLMNMQVASQKSGGKSRIIYHAHCTNLIAMTFLLPLKDEVFTRELWEMMTECPVVFPEGIGVVEWMVPGGREIAVATSQKMQQYNAVVWAHHGLFVSGEDFDSTFGLMHTIEKSAEVWIKVHSCGHGKRQSITVEEFRKLAKEFGVALNENALYSTK